MRAYNDYPLRFATVPVIKGRRVGFRRFLAVVMSEVGHGGRGRCALKITIRGLM